MAKQRITLDLTPSDKPFTFERVVSIPTEDGKALKIPFDFIHRDRIALAKMHDEMRALKAPVFDDDASEVDKVQALIQIEVDNIKRVAAGWGLEAEFSDANIALFVRRYPGAAAEITADYAVSVVRGRLGN